VTPIDTEFEVTSSHIDLTVTASHILTVHRRPELLVLDLGLGLDLDLGLGGSVLVN